LWNTMSFVLTALSLGAFAPSPSLRHTSRLPTGAMAIIRCSANSPDLDLQIVKRMQESFWAQKKARLQAETETRLREIDEYAAREAALASAVGSAPALEASAEVAILQAALEVEREKNAALMAELQSVKVDAELNLQKASAFWIAKLEAAKALPAAAEQEATALVPEAKADSVPSAESLVPATLSLREIRSRLLACAAANFTFLLVQVHPGCTDRMYSVHVI